ncbi:MAG: recombinase [Eubacterium sp.]|nr:recombinase [Eubacterium sp.]
MVGKGSVNHNSRVFNAKNTNPERTYLNKEYINDDIQKVYHELFDDALERYNAKQTRSDRKINDYYEKICSGKQEKPFHEIIVQIGNCDNMKSDSENGELAEKILDEYMKSFQQRNPNLRVFSAHLHMDEATPHLHIDFVPFTTGSKRGLDTRVSLKQALKSQGYIGNGKSETEWAVWVQSEKETLAVIMERNEIEWEHLDTHEKHLSVLDYEKKIRSQEIDGLESKIEILDKQMTNLLKCEDTFKKVSQDFETDEQFQLPEPQPLMSAKSYKTKIVEPFVNKLKSTLKTVVVANFKLKNKLTECQKENTKLYFSNVELREQNDRLLTDNFKQMKSLKDYKLLRKILGTEQVNNLLVQVRRKNKRFERNYNYENRI